MISTLSALLHVHLFDDEITGLEASFSKLIQIQIGGPGLLGKKLGHRVAEPTRLHDSMGTQAVVIEDSLASGNRSDNRAFIRRELVMPHPTADQFGVAHRIDATNQSRRD